MTGFLAWHRTRKPSNWQRRWPLAGGLSTTALCPHSYTTSARHQDLHRCAHSREGKHGMSPVQAKDVKYSNWRVPNLVPDANARHVIVAAFGRPAPQTLQALAHIMPRGSKLVIICQEHVDKPKGKFHTTIIKGVLPQAATQPPCCKARCASLHRLCCCKAGRKCRSLERARCSLQLAFHCCRPSRQQQAPQEGGHRACRLSHARWSARA